MEKNQAKYRIRVKSLLLKKRMSVKDLAARIGSSRTATSQAINRYRFPRVRGKINQELDIV